MKKFKDIYNKKMLVYLGLFIVFLFLPISKASAELIINSSTGPANNTITALDINSVDFTVDFQVLCTDPTAVDNLWFQPYIDGVKQPPNALGARYIWNGKVVDYCNKTLKISFSDKGVYARDSKVYSWKLTDSTGKIEYVSKSFTYKINTNDKGFYYIYKKSSGTENKVYFNRSNRFDTEALCIADKNTFFAQNPEDTIYKECQLYNYLPDLTTPEYEDIFPLSNIEYEANYHPLAPLTKEQADNGIDTTNIGSYFNTIFNIGLGLAAALAVIMIIIGGVEWMGTDSVFGKTEARKRITSAILGLLIALGAFALLNTINPALLGKNGLNVSSANIKLEFKPTSGGGYFGGTIGDASNPNVNKNITQWDPYLKNASQTYGIECTVLKAFMYAESSGVNSQTSPANAKGLMQLIDTTFQAQNVGTDPMDPQTNINAGAKYLKNLQSTGCNTKPTSSVCDISKMQYWAASYNGGPGANQPSEKCSGMTVWQCPQTICNNGTDCFAETRAYALKVEANYNKLKENGWGC